MSDYQRIMEKLYKEINNIYKPIAEFFRQMGLSKHGKEILDNPDLMYLYLVNAAPAIKYSSDIMRARYAVELKIHSRYSHDVGQTKTDMGKSDIFAKYVDLLTEMLHYSVYEAVRTMMYISCFCGEKPEVPHTTLELMHECEKKEREERNEIIRKTERAEHGTRKEMEEAARRYLTGNVVEKDWSAAYKIAEKADINGFSPDARATMGYILYRENKQPGDKEKGLELLCSAAKTGSARAEKLYAVSLYAEGHKEDGFRWIKRAAEHGDSGAYCTVGTAYLKGNNVVRQDLHEAVKWFRLGEKEGNVDCIFQLATVYAYGDVISYKESLEYLEKAARLGNEEAPNLLYVEYMRENNKEGEQDFAKAAVFLCMDAKRKNTDAIYKLADLWKEKKISADNKDGIWYDANEAELCDKIRKLDIQDILARRWFEEYLLLGGKNIPSDAVRFFGNTKRGLEVLEVYGKQEFDAIMSDDKYDHIYEKRLLAGIFRRCGKNQLNNFGGYALELYKDISKHGDDEAACIRAEMYLNGEGTPSDPGKALKILRKVAAKGNLTAMYLLIRAARMAEPGEEGERKSQECIKIAKTYCHRADSPTNSPLCNELLGRISEEETHDGAADLHYAVACKKYDMKYSLMRLCELYKDIPEEYEKYLKRGADAGIPELLVEYAEFSKDNRFLPIIHAYDLCLPEAAEKLSELIRKNDPGQEDIRFADDLLCLAKKFKKE